MGKNMEPQPTLTDKILHVITAIIAGVVLFFVIKFVIHLTFLIAHWLFIVVIALAALGIGIAFATKVHGNPWQKQ